MEFCALSAGSLPNFCNLKQLTIMVNAYEYELAPINQFLKACPKLRKFKVEFRNMDDSLLEEASRLKELDSSSDDVETEMTQDWEYFESMYEMEIERTGHPNLKEFQVAGFCGWKLDVDLILFIVLISCNLETIICDYSFRTLVGNEVVEVSKSRAAKLVKLIPPKIRLVITPI
ncbi:uncharacterized protein LOC141631786 [Silene latifolia]|uniref:uncharacterized protein LOC141631786 n=1 Tax=Silene latifolia TaxID=37657 RepID=UPI003D7788C3